VTNPKPEVNVLLRHIDLAVGEEEPERDVWVLGEERERDGQQVSSPEHLRRGDVQFAPGRAVLARSLPLGLLHLLQDAPCRRDIRAPGIGELHTPARAHEELGSQVPLQVRHLAAYRGKRSAQAPRRGRDAALLDYGEQHPHGVKSIHRAFRNLRGSIPKV
jgi:hypothetical protein